MDNDHYKLESFENGNFSIRDLRVGEAMHSSIGPWNEAQTLYIQESDLKFRLEAKSTNLRPLVIYDVGLGIAANALAALDCFLQSSQRDVYLVSFENDLQGLQLALENSDHFPFFSGKEDLLRKLSTQNFVKLINLNGATLSWNLYLGDFRENLASTPSPDLIFYDFYSPKTCPDLWGLGCFKLLWNTCQKSQDLEAGATLLTYTASTAARAAMLLAGFYVGYGASTASKRETTIASTLRKNIVRPLDAAWLSRWERSSRGLPSDCDSSPCSQKEFTEKIPELVQRSW